MIKSGRYFNDDEPKFETKTAKDIDIYMKKITDMLKCQKPKVNKIDTNIKLTMDQFYINIHPTFIHILKVIDSPTL